MSTEQLSEEEIMQSGMGDAASSSRKSEEAGSVLFEDKSRTSQEDKPDPDFQDIGANPMTQSDIDRMEAKQQWQDQQDALNKQKSAQQSDDISDTQTVISMTEPDMTAEQSIINVIQEKLNNDAMRNKRIYSDDIRERAEDAIKKGDLNKLGQIDSEMEQLVQQEPQNPREMPSGGHVPSGTMMGPSDFEQQQDSDIITPISSQISQTQIDDPKKDIISTQTPTGIALPSQTPMGDPNKDIISITQTPAGIALPSQKPIQTPLHAAKGDDITQTPLPSAIPSEYQPPPQDIESDIQPDEDEQKAELLKKTSGGDVISSVGTTPVPKSYHSPKKSDHSEKQTDITEKTTDVKKKELETKLNILAQQSDIDQTAVNNLINQVKTAGDETTLNNIEQQFNELNKAKKDKVHKKLAISKKINKLREKLKKSKLTEAEKVKLEKRLNFFDDQMAKAEIPDNLDALETDLNKFEQKELPGFVNRATSEIKKLASKMIKPGEHTYVVLNSIALLLHTVAAFSTQVPVIYWIAISLALITGMAAVIVGKDKILNIFIVAATICLIIASIIVFSHKRTTQYKHQTKEEKMKRMTSAHWYWIVQIYVIIATCSLDRPKSLDSDDDVVGSGD